MKNWVKRKSIRFLSLLLMLAMAAAILEPASASAATYYMSVDEAIVAVRSGLAQRKTDITVYVSSTIDFFEDSAVQDNIFLPAVAETGSSDYRVGDYLNEQWWGHSTWVTQYSKAKWKIEFLDIKYATNAEQEREFDTKLNQVINDLNLWNKSDYMKYQGIYQYICDHVVYDDVAYEASSAGDSSAYRLSYSAYSALTRGTAVCAGYASLFYAMCKAMGLPVRIITGTANGKFGWGNHALNAVMLDGEWYQVDVTWDAGDQPERWRYFIKGESYFPKHAPEGGATYNNLSFSDYLVKDSDWEAVSRFRDTAEGTTCYYAAWVLSDMGVISGTGKYTFSPEGILTRGQMVTMLYRYHGEPGYNAVNTFADIPEDAYYRRAAEWAASAGIVSGFGDGSFRGDDPLTYEQIAVILDRFSGIIGMEVTGRDIILPSEGISEYAYDSIYWALSSGVMDSPLYPKSAVTRGDAAVMLYRLMLLSDQYRPEESQPDIHDYHLGAA